MTPCLNPTTHYEKPVFTTTIFMGDTLTLCYVIPFLLSPYHITLTEFSIWTLNGKVQHFKQWQKVCIWVIVTFFSTKKFDYVCMNMSTSFENKSLVYKHKILRTPICMFLYSLAVLTSHHYSVSNRTPWVLVVRVFIPGFRTRYFIKKK